MVTAMGHQHGLSVRGSEMRASHGEIGVSNAHPDMVQPGQIGNTTARAQG